jgi:hypothetical protein
MIRRAVASLTLFAPLALLIQAEGCATEPLPQDLCSWLADSNNCYARFADDIIAGTTSPRCGQIAKDDEPSESTTGFFQDRTDLSICIITGGGQIIFDPPLDVTTFPPTEIAFKMLDEKALACGEGSFQGAQSYSVKIEAAELEDADDVLGGSFSISQTAGRERFDVGCPGGQENHNFNALTLERCIGSTPSLPAASLESSPGIPGATVNAAGSPGYIRFRVSYPTPNDDSGTGGAAAAGTGEGTTVVEYFNCSIPAPPPACSDGVQNNTESDIDCGGGCNAKCDTGKSCNSADDCSSGNCEAPEGVKVCGE